MPMAKTRIGAPMSGRTAKIASIRPGGPTLEELPKQKVEKSRVRTTRERNALDQAYRHYRDRQAATVTSYAHGEIRTLIKPNPKRLFD